MKITFEGRTWEFDEDAITIRQAIAMHLAYGFTLQSWLDAMATADPRAWQCAYWLMLQQGGEVKPIAECDFPLVAFMTAYAEASTEGQPQPEVPEVPTIPPSPSGDPPSPEPATPTATTPALSPVPELPLTGS